MSDLEWAEAFVGAKLPKVGRRFQESVDVLVEKLKQVREEAQQPIPIGTHDDRNDAV